MAWAGEAACILLLVHGVVHAVHVHQMAITAAATPAIGQWSRTRTPIWRALVALQLSKLQSNTLSV